MGLRQQPRSVAASGRLPAVPAARGPPGRGTAAVSGGGFLTSGLEGPIGKHGIWAGAQCPRFGDLKSLLRNSRHPPPEPSSLPEWPRRKRAVLQRSVLRPARPAWGQAPARLGSVAAEARTWPPLLPASPQVLQVRVQGNTGSVLSEGTFFFSFELRAL